MAPTPSPSASARPPRRRGDDRRHPHATPPTWRGSPPRSRRQFDGLDCSDPARPSTRSSTTPTKPLVTCATTTVPRSTSSARSRSSGDKISDATSGYQSNQQGNVTSEVEIALTLNGDGAKQYADISRKMVALPEPQNQLAATLDSKVIVAPRFNEAILDGRASITGGFTLDSARSLADQLKFGALPLSFVEQTSIDISPTLGSEQLRYGLIAGLIGLLLVVGYSLLQYRALGFVTVASILVAGLITYLTITILGWSHNYRLDMAGVTGLIVAIGFTADSFIVYFERVRDELRDGRSLRAAVETGWNRAKRTILVADGVNFLAALTLYALASSSVRGFAFTLGLTTLIDLLVVFLFTHPVAHAPGAAPVLPRRPRLVRPRPAAPRGPDHGPVCRARPFRQPAHPPPPAPKEVWHELQLRHLGNDLYTGKRSITSSRSAAASTSSRWS